MCQLSASGLLLTVVSWELMETRWTSWQADVYPGRCFRCWCGLYWHSMSMP
jgi:hypothetical protein